MHTRARVRFNILSVQGGGASKSNKIWLKCAIVSWLILNSEGFPDAVLGSYRWLRNLSIISVALIKSHNAVVRVWKAPAKSYLRRSVSLAEPISLILLRQCDCLSSPSRRVALRRLLHLGHYISIQKLVQRMQISQWQSKRSTVQANFAPSTPRWRETQFASANGSRREIYILRADPSQRIGRIQRAEVKFTGKSTSAVLLATEWTILSRRWPRIWNTTCGGGARVPEILEVDEALLPLLNICLRQGSLAITSRGETKHLVRIRIADRWWFSYDRRFLPYRN